ncbi:MAG: hypothetical protein OXI75_12090 [Rhodospirillales bacterium]|nr:hypothetical protein [Rhodospirillales bacterium]
MQDEATKADDAGQVIDLDDHTPDGSLSRPFKQKDIRAMQAALRKRGVDIRLNVLNRRVEWRGLKEPDCDPWLDRGGTKWTALDDFRAAALRQEIAAENWYEVPRAKGDPDVRRLMFSREDFADKITAHVDGRRVHPFADYLTQLQWDGTPRIEGLLINLFGAEWSALTEWGGQYMFLGAVQRTFAPGSALDEVLVIIGDQGQGKSKALRHSLPPEFRDMFGDGLAFSARRQEQVEAILGRVLIEVPEMGGVKRAEQDDIKALITRQDDGAVRLPYHRYPVPLPRRCAFVVTTNDPDNLPNDPSGNRRFVPVVLRKGANVEAYMRDNRDQCWAEAVQLYLDGRRANLPLDMRDRQREAAELHRDRDDLVEDAVADLHGNGPYKLADIIGRLEGAAANASPHRVGRALRNTGWTLKRTAAGRLWERGA